MTNVDRVKEVLSMGNYGTDVRSESDGSTMTEDEIKSALELFEAILRRKRVGFVMALENDTKIQALRGMAYGNGTSKPEVLKAFMAFLNIDAKTLATLALLEQ